MCFHTHVAINPIIAAKNKCQIFYLDAACDSRGFTANLLRLSLLAVEKHLFV